MIGNALGDGKPKDNTTDPKTETFAEKYRRELKKDMEDLGAEDELDLGLDDDLDLDGGDTIDLDALMGDDDEEVDPLEALMGGDDEEEPEEQQEKAEEPIPQDS